MEHYGKHTSLVHHSKTWRQCHKTLEMCGHECTLIFTPGKSSIDSNIHTVYGHKNNGAYESQAADKGGGAPTTPQPHPPLPVSHLNGSPFLERLTLTDTS